VSVVGDLDLCDVVVLWPHYFPRPCMYPCARLLAMYCCAPVPPTDLSAPANKNHGCTAHKVKSNSLFTSMSWPLRYVIESE